MGCTKGPHAAAAPISSPPDDSKGGTEVPGEQGEATTMPADLPRGWAAAQTPRRAGEGAHGWRRTPTGTPLLGAWPGAFSPRPPNSSESSLLLPRGDKSQKGRASRGWAPESLQQTLAERPAPHLITQSGQLQRAPAPSSKLSSPFLPPAIPATREINVISARPEAAPAPSCCTGSCCDSPWARAPLLWPRMAQGPGTAQGSHSLPLRTGGTEPHGHSPPEPHSLSCGDRQTDRAAGLGCSTAAPCPILSKPPRGHFEGDITGDEAHPQLTQTPGKSPGNPLGPRTQHSRPSQPTWGIPQLDPSGALCTWGLHGPPATAPAAGEQQLQKARRRPRSTHLQTSPLATTSRQRSLQSTPATSSSVSRLHKIKKKT